MKRILAIAIIAAFVLCSWGCTVDGTKAADAYIAAKNMEKVAAETMSVENIARMKTGAKEYAQNGIDTVEDTGDIYENRARNLGKMMEGEVEKTKKTRPTIKISMRQRMYKKAKEYKAK